MSVCTPRLPPRNYTHSARRPLICGPCWNHSEADWGMYEIVRLALAADQKAQRKTRRAARCAGMKKPLCFFAKRTIFSYVPKKTHSSALICVARRRRKEVKQQAAQVTALYRSRGVVKHRVPPCGVRFGVLLAEASRPQLVCHASI